MSIWVTALVGIALVAGLCGFRLQRSLILKRFLISIGAVLVVVALVGSLRTYAAMSQIHEVPGMPEVAKAAREYKRSVLLADVWLGLLGVFLVGAGIFDKQIFPAGVDLQPAAKRT